MSIKSIRGQIEHLSNKIKTHEISAVSTKLDNDVIKEHYALHVINRTVNDNP